MKQLFFLGILGLLLSLTIFNGWRFYQLSIPAAEQRQTIVATPLRDQSNKIPSARVISSWNLMGKIKPAIVVQAPKTNLNLTLIGVISSTVDGQARAIVEDSSRKQKHYKVDDKIKNNVTVKSIESDHIVIIHNSRDEILQLKSLKSKKPIIKKVVIQ